MAGEVVTVALSKHEGAGNDFLIMIDLDQRVALTPAEVRQMTDRHTGIGADGLIILSGPSGGGEVTMTLKNQDGSDAEISGNGARCAAHEAVRSGLVAAGAFSMMTGSGLRRMSVQPIDVSMAESSIEMGPVRIESLDEAGRCAHVDVGNPHLVMVVDDLAGIDLVGDGERLQATRPGGINVEWLAMEGDANASMKVYERGVGPTLACGSGSTAAVGAARALGVAGDHVDVENPGGRLVIDFDGDVATLSGPVRFVADILMPLVRTA